MGDVFRGGNQNIVATIDSSKISTQEFSRNFQQDLNLYSEQLGQQLTIEEANMNPPLNNSRKPIKYNMIL